MQQPMGNFEFEPVLLNNQLQRSDVHPMNFPISMDYSARACRFKCNQDKDYSILARKGRADYAVRNYIQFDRRTTPDTYLLDIIKQHLKPGDPILELGCNHGNNLLPLAKQGYSLYGVDISKEVLETIEAKIRKEPHLEKQIRLAQWDFGENGDVPWPEIRNRFKAIVSVHVLSHFSAAHLIKTMQRIQDYLAPGGLMIVTIIKPGAKSTIAPEYRLLGGYIEHDDATVEKAFAGLQRLEASRPFKPGELTVWKLPEKQIEWLVFQKPVS